MAAHSSVLLEIPWTEESGGLQSMGSQSRAWLSNWTTTTSAPRNVILFGYRVVAILEWGHTEENGLALTTTAVLVGRQSLKTETHREDAPYKKAETRGMQLQTEENQGLLANHQELGRGKDSPAGFRGNMALLTPRFQISSLWNCETVNFCCFKPSKLYYFVTAAPGN